MTQSYSLYLSAMLEALEHFRSMRTTDKEQLTADLVKELCSLGTRQ